MRRLTISEEFGLYHIQTESGEATGGTLEAALLNAIQQAGIPGVEVHSMFEASEMLDALLGKGRESGQIREGVVSG